MKRTISKRIIAVLICTFLVCMTGFAPLNNVFGASKKSKTVKQVPAIDSAVNTENALAIAEAYDPDGAYILKDAISRGDDFYFWMVFADSNAEGLDTCVHEEFHGYTHSTKQKDSTDNTVLSIGSNKEMYYLGDGKNKAVTLTNVFKTEEWSKDLPASLRTFRYNQYVASGATPDANTKGVYGLLNEFSAYCWGMNNQINLFEYYKAQPFDLSTWGSYAYNCENDYNAYCEFRYYILGYLNYAKKNHKDIYNNILNNQNFIDVYCFMKEKFDSLVEKYEEQQQEITRIGEEQGKYIIFSDGYLTFSDGASPNDYWGFISSATTIGSGDQERNALLSEINSKELQAQEKALFEKYSLKSNSSSKSSKSSKTSKTSTTTKSTKIKKGSKIYSSDGSVYKVTKTGTKKSAGKVTFSKASEGLAAVGIPSVLTDNGIKYNVTGIGSKAFQNNDDVEFVRIGQNVKNIGANAFDNCPNLKNIVIESTKLSASSVKSGAFSKLAKNITVTVPEAKLDAYKKALTNAGLKNAKIEAKAKVDLSSEESKHQYYKNVSSENSKKADKIAKQIAEDVMNNPLYVTDLQRVNAAAIEVASYCDNAAYGTDNDKYYRTPYGVFVAKVFTCAGSTRALGRVLNYMGFTWEHQNENQNSHQWCILTMDGQTGFADGMSGIAGYGEYKSGMKTSDGRIIIF